MLVDRLKINGSLARKALADLEERGVIKKVVAHSKMQIYSEWLSRSQDGIRQYTNMGIARAIGGDE